jgi:hypothetical protein
MCIVIDANCFGCVFNPNVPGHERFVPVYNWVMQGWGGRLIYGGTKYKEEVSFDRGKYLGILVELERKGRLLPIQDAVVDEFAASVKSKVNDGDFDDEHIVALVAISRCCVVCTDDKRSFPFLRRADLYPKGVKPPKIYQYKRHAKLCGAEHVAKICRGHN